jgi:hypothetical protein
VLHMLASSGDDAMVGAIAVGGSMMIAIVAIIVGAMRKTMTARAREESRREIAAYVAEGSISADDAAKLLAAGGSISDQIKGRVCEKMGA